MASLDDLSIGPKAEEIRQKLRENKLHDENIEPTREERAKMAAEKAEENFIKKVQEEEDKLASLMTHGCRMVANVEVASMSAEVTALTNDLNEERKWIEKIEEDEDRVKSSLRKIEETWEEIKKMEVAENLQQTLQDLKDESENLIEQKRFIINGLKNYLSSCDEAFNNETLKHAQQRTQIVGRTTEHVMELIKAYRTSIEELQETSNEQYEKLHAYYTEEMNKAIQELDTKLQKLMEERRRKNLERKEELIAMQVVGSDRQVSLQKVKEKHLQDENGGEVEKILLELYRLNSRRKVEEEHLSFNLEVLKEQFRESTLLVSECRRKLNALRPIAQELKRKEEEEKKMGEKFSKSKYEKMLKEKVRLRELQERLHQTIVASQAKIRGVTYMNYEKFQDYVMKIHELDRTISLSVLAEENPQTDEVELQMLKELHPALQPKDTPALAAAVNILQMKEEDPLSDRTDEDQILEESFLKKMSKASTFLIDPPEDNSPPLMILEQIFWELGIATENDVNKILSIAKCKFFENRKRFPESQYSSDEGISEIPGLFTDEEILETLVQFASERNKEEREEKCKVKKVSGFASFDPEIYYNKWSELTEMILKTRSKKWKMIKDALEKYYVVLSNRFQQSERVEKLRQENRELKYLLQGLDMENLEA